MSKPTIVSQKHVPQTWRERWYVIIFEADTPAGKLFDVLLLIAILLSVLVVMCESVESFRKDHRALLENAEWFFTLLFTVEYGVRIVCARRPMRYIFSLYGVVDLLAILPTYLVERCRSSRGDEVRSASGCHPGAAAAARVPHIQTGPHAIGSHRAPAGGLGGARQDRRLFVLCCSSRSSSLDLRCILIEGGRTP